MTRHITGDDLGVGIVPGDGILPSPHDIISPDSAIDTPSSGSTYEDKLEYGDEKGPVPGSTKGEHDWESDDFKDIPDLVRETVSFDDDPNEAYLTFRVFVLSALFCTLGSCCSMLTYFRTTTAPFPVFFVILGSLPLGRLMARTLPDRKITFWRWSFSLNPGLFTNKEHVMIGVAANAGSQGQWSFFLPANAAMYYGITMNPAVALFFAWGTALIGFSFAAMVRPILIEDPKFLFPTSLQQVAVYRSLHNAVAGDTFRAAKQMKVFWYVFAGFFVWQFFPEYIFPFTAALAPLCWFASQNHVANFIGAGRGGMGLLNITLDWSNITSTIVTFPYSTQVTVFLGFVLTTWILIPVSYFGELWGSPKYPVMSNQVFAQNGTKYPFAEMLYTDSHGQQQLNETMYHEVGLAAVGPQFLWNIFFWYAAYLSAYVWCGLFLGRKIWRVIKARRENRFAHNDRLTKLVRQYQPVGWKDWLALFIIPAAVLLGLVVSGKVWMPTFTYFVALGFGITSMLPMSLIYATSGFPMQIGTFNELVYGYMLEAKGSSRHPLGQLAYRILSGNTWYDARTVLEDQKIGHYFHLPPRAVIGIQIFGTLLATPVNYAIMRAVLATKMEYVSGRKIDPNGQWTGQNLLSYNTDGVLYALVGPKRLFEAAMFKPLPYGFIVGIAAPIIIWLLCKTFKRIRFDLFNTTIFFSSAAKFHGNISTGPFTMILLGTFSNFFLYRYRHTFWNKFAYIIGAAADTGFNANLLFLFIALGTSGLSMPNWWGNNAQNVERCFALKR